MALYNLPHIFDLCKSAVKLALAAIKGDSTMAELADVVQNTLT